jgi:hypothetical protein
MASIKELERTLPAHYTMSNQTLIITAHVGEETAYFYHQLGPHTTVIMLSKPECYIEYRIFLELINDLGGTAITLDEDEDFSPDYVLGERSQNIIGNLIQNYSFQRIVIHPKYPRTGNGADPQNREIHDFIRQIQRKSGDKLKDKVYTYNKIGIYGQAKAPCGIQKGIIELYSAAADPDKKENPDKLKAFVSTASFIDGIRLLRDNE